MDTLETASVTFKGTMYKRGMVVQQNDTGYMFGKIVLILINQSCVHFVVEQYQSVPVVDMGVHCLQNSNDACYVCLTMDSLADYYPLPAYNQFGLHLIAMHHSVCYR